ncbi:MAG: hypothetical protein ACYTE8_06570 [Planctomycetota bacterium]
MVIANYPQMSWGELFNYTEAVEQENDEFKEKIQDLECEKDDIICELEELIEKMKKRK